MCLGVPMKVVALEGTTATVEVGGIRKETSVEFLDGVKEGDYVIVHAGFAIQKVTPEDASETLELFDRYNVPKDN